MRNFVVLDLFFVGLVRTETSQQPDAAPRSRGEGEKNRERESVNKTVQRLQRVLVQGD